MFKEHAEDFEEILNGKVETGNVEGFLSQICCRSGTRCAVLDLGCGTGRLLDRLSRFASVVTALDYSPRLLARATERSRTLANVVPILGDMRNLGHIFPDGCFDIVLRAYTTLGYFDRATELGILGQCHRVLADNGAVIVDTFNAKWFRAQKNGSRRTRIGDFELEETYRWDEPSRMVRCTWRYIKDNDSEVVIDFDLEGYDLDTINQMFRQTGLKVEGIYSALDPAALISADNESERLVVVGRREAGEERAVRRHFFPQESSR